MRPAPIRIVLAVAIVGLLVAHAVTWAPTQILWACHVASFVMALGLALDLPRPVAVTLAFHVGQGIPAWMIDLFVTGENSVTSTLLHVIPLGAGLWMLWPRPFPRGVLLPAYLIHPGAMVLAYLFADPALNVMLVHQPYGPAAGLFDSLWIVHAVNIALSVLCVTVGWLVLRYVVWRKR